MNDAFKALAQAVVEAIYLVDNAIENQSEYIEASEDDSEEAQDLADLKALRRRLEAGVRAAGFDIESFPE